jgi:hypothetical protein
MIREDRLKERFCEKCGHALTRNGTKGKSAEGEVEKLAYFTCTNPECQNSFSMPIRYRGIIQ